MKDEFTKTKEIMGNEVRSDSRLTTHDLRPRQMRGRAPNLKCSMPENFNVSDNTFPEKIWMIFSNATMMKSNEYVETWTV